ncbi:retrovirus-related pol polyprotein from transposon TNT 1-94 [Tanacetum coccineum]
MLLFLRLPEFLWAEAVSTACFTQNRSIIHARYNKTPYELLHNRKPNVEYFNVFGSLCYPTNNRDDLEKMKLKQTLASLLVIRKHLEGLEFTINEPKRLWKLDMASEHDSLEPVSQRFINDDSSAESMNTPFKEDLDKLFRPMYDEYFEKKSFNMPINFDAQQVHNHEDSSSTFLIDIEAHEAPPIVTTSKEQTSLTSLTEADEFYQEDSAKYVVNSV